MVSIFSISSIFCIFGIFGVFGMFGIFRTMALVSERVSVDKTGRIFGRATLKKPSKIHENLEKFGPKPSKMEP